MNIRCSNPQCESRTGGDEGIFNHTATFDSRGDLAERGHSAENFECCYCFSNAEDVPAFTELFINSLGELTRDTSLLDTSISLKKLAKDEGLSWPVTEGEEWKSLLDRAWQKKLDLVLSAEEKSFVLWVYELQNAVANTSRWRIYARLKYVSVSRKVEEKEVHLQTELCNFVDQESYWDTVEDFAIEHGCTVRTMREDEHLDKYKPVGAEEWVEGPNHGRMERQVELYWTLTPSETRQSVEAFVKDLNERTQALWDEAGVSVL